MASQSGPGETSPSTHGGGTKLSAACPALLGPDRPFLASTARLSGTRMSSLMPAPPSESPHSP
jgi:hypothetical protein